MPKPFSSVVAERLGRLPRHLDVFPHDFETFGVWINPADPRQAGGAPFIFPRKESAEKFVVLVREDAALADDVVSASLDSGGQCVWATAAMTVQREDARLKSLAGDARWTWLETRHPSLREVWSGSI
jgi:hypothetical protein